MDKPNESRTICAECKSRIETPWHEGICCTCESFSWLPPRYDKREHYRMDVKYSTPGSPHRYAMVCPSTGNPVLDEKKIKFSEILLSPAEAKAWAEREALEGLLDDV